MPRRNRRNVRPSQWDMDQDRNRSGGARLATNTVLLAGLVIAIIALMLFVFGLGRDTPVPSEDLPEGHIRVPLDLPDQSFNIRQTEPGANEALKTS